MWSYYGSKATIVKSYPKPVKGTKIIEPFAGTARYALEHFDHDVLIVDKYDVIVKIWKWLQKCSPGDIRSLPRFKAGDNINTHSYNCEEERMLVGFLVGFGFTNPRQTATPRLRNRPNAMNYTISKIADNLWKIKHWDIRHGSFEAIPNENATWFIDPPYQYGGEYYKCSNRDIDYTHLAEWCKSREGFVIVCENSKADWLPFIPFRKFRALAGKQHEVIWTNKVTAFHNQQLTLITP